MKTSMFIVRAQFFFLVIAPFGIALFLIAFFYGCQQKAPEQKPVATVTLENLQTALNKQVKYQHMYTLFAQRAEKEHQKNIAHLYRALARAEEIHAADHRRLIKTLGGEPVTPALDALVIGTTLQTLKMAISSVEPVVESMYPNLIHTAELENVPDAVKQFKAVKDADARQLELLKEALNKNMNISKTPYYLCPKCGYVFNSEGTDKCPNCQVTKEQFEIL